MKQKLFFNLMLLMSCASGFAETVVVPNNLANKPGDVGVATFSEGPQRSQQLYMGTDLQPLLPNGALITEVRFRAHAPFQQFSISGTFTDFEVRLSTAPKTATFMSPFFAQNVGGDETVVRPRGSLDWQLVNDGTSSAQSFSLVIPLPTPFYYDPTSGNLLMDIRNYKVGAREGPSALDYIQTSSATALVWGGLTSPSGDGVIHGGFVTQFGFANVPEPSAAMLLLAGFFCIAAAPGAKAKIVSKS